MSIILSALGLTIAVLSLPATLELLIVTAGVLRPLGRSRLTRGTADRPKVERLKIVVPAHNEGASIGRCVSSLRAQLTDREFEVVVVADNCTDETARIATDSGARVLVRNDPERRGKGFALRFAFEALAREPFGAILVVDADSTVSPNMVQEVAASIESGADAVQCRYEMQNPEQSLHRRLLNVALMAFNVVRSLGRDRWGLSVGLLGNGFALSRLCLERVPYVAHSVVEDLEYHLMLVGAGMRVRFAGAATVFGEMPTARKAAETQRSRWEGGRLRMAREYVPRLARSVLRGEGRFAEPLLELLCPPLALHVAVLLLLLLFPVSACRAYSAAALAIVAAHVLSAAVVGGKFWSSIGALATAPLYIVWKLAIIPAVLRGSRRNSAWIRSHRDAEGL